MYDFVAGDAKFLVSSLAFLGEFNFFMSLTFNLKALNNIFISLLIFGILLFNTGKCLNM